MAGQPLDPAGSTSSRPRLMKTHMSDVAACFKLHRTELCVRCSIVLR